MMPIDLLINELLKVIAWGIGIFVVIEFIKTKDGILRKIMITYFSIEVFIYLSSGIDSYLEWRNHHLVNPLLLSDLLLLPKDAVKIWFLWYLVRGRKNN